jgi:excisionase family DNA binding protein
VKGTALPVSMNLVTIAVAAEYIGVSGKTIRRRIADGSLPAWRVGPRLLRVNLDDVGQVLLRRIPAAGTRPPL